LQGELQYKTAMFIELKRLTILREKIAKEKTPCIINYIDQNMTDGTMARYASIKIWLKNKIAHLLMCYFNFYDVLSIHLDLNQY
jgi:hypothetical protein